MKASRGCPIGEDQDTVELSPRKGQFEGLPQIPRSRQVQVIVVLLSPLPHAPVRDPGLVRPRMGLGRIGHQLEQSPHR